MLGTITINDFKLYEGDIEPLIIGAVALIVVYLIIDMIAWRKFKKITFYADVLAPITVFVLAILFSFAIWRIQDWAIMIPFIMVIGYLPVSILLTIIKVIVVLIKKINKST
ncbi:hypothetical protein [Jeotgalicoccus psychrophilus]|uniref:hypothetical protein n=1 Tax=Jeotgalicoccus psychrophilus TaxID=157228 RepID=UPI00040BE291|nr:hypothetical protein [Jeotgalicoccus psychrophilus]